MITGDGSAELFDDDSIEIAFAYHNGDEATLKVEREPSSITRWRLVAPRPRSGAITYEDQNQSSDLHLPRGRCSIKL